MSNLIELQTAYATQLTTEEGKGEWVMFNTEKEEIYRLPKDWTEKQVMVAIHLARKFELLAFNKGVQFEKDKRPQEIKNLQAIVKNLNAEKQLLVKSNNELATELDNLITKYEK